MSFYEPCHVKRGLRISDEALSKSFMEYGLYKVNVVLGDPASSYGGSALQGKDLFVISKGTHWILFQSSGDSALTLMCSASLAVTTLLQRNICQTILKHDATKGTKY
jgi:hypothetical protein